MSDPILDLGICLVLASAAFLCLIGIGAVVKHFCLGRDIAQFVNSCLESAQGE